MTITKRAIIDAITIRPSGHVEIRSIIRAIEDEGLETEDILGERYNRRTIAPEDDITNEPLKLQRICNIARGL